MYLLGGHTEPTGEVGPFGRFLADEDTDGTDPGIEVVPEPTIEVGRG